MKKHLLLLMFLPFLSFAKNVDSKETLKSDRTEFSCNPEIVDETILGTQVLCLYDEATFYLVFEQINGGELEVTWESSPNVNISNSGNGHVSFAASGNGAAHVIATITSMNSCGSTTVTVQYDFWIGKPEISNGVILGPTLVCTNDNATFNLLFSLQGGLNPTVTWHHSANVNITSNDNGHATIVATGTGNAYVTAIISLTNDCGTTSIAVTHNFWIGKPIIHSASILGADLLCGTNSSSYLLSINSSGGGNLSVTWTSSSNVTITNSDVNGADIVPNGTGAAFVKATITLTNACGCAHSYVVQKDFWIGAPATPNVFFPHFGPFGCGLAMIAVVPPGSSQQGAPWYYWNLAGATIPSGSGANPQNGYDHYGPDFNFYVETGNGQRVDVCLTVYSMNQCGISSKSHCWARTCNGDGPYSELLMLSDEIETTRNSEISNLENVQSDSESNSAKNLQASDNSTTEINVFPNPTKGEVFIELSADFNMDAGENTFEVYNSLGKKVLEITSKEESLKLDLKNFKSGIYLVKVSNQERTMTKRVMLN